MTYDDIFKRFNSDEEIMKKKLNNLTFIDFNNKLKFVLKLGRAITEKRNILYLEEFSEDLINLHKYIINYIINILKYFYFLYNEDYLKFIQDFYYIK